MIPVYSRRLRDIVDLELEEWYGSDKAELERELTLVELMGVEGYMSLPIFNHDTEIPT